MKPLLIIDSNQLCYSAFYRTGNLTYKGKDTGIIFGFLVELFGIVKYFKAIDYTIVFTWDSRKNFRKYDYIPYKQGRAKKRKEVGLEQKHYKQFDELRKEILPQIGFQNIFMEVGFEADDIIAQLCQQYQLRRKIIVSTDEDLYQLLDMETDIYKTKSKKLYTMDNLFKEYPGLISTRNWIDVKALAGCSTDNVKGITGVGYKTAVAYLSGSLNKDSKIYKKIITKHSQTRYRRNIPLVTIPYPEEEIKNFKIKKNRLNYEAFSFLCTDLGFRSIEKNMKAWAENFKF
jgi:DNA polymerase-1